MTEEFSPELRASAWTPMRLSYAFGRELADFGLINATSLFNLMADVAKAKSPADLGDAWLDFWRRQFEAFSEQFEELSTLSKEPPSSAVNWQFKVGLRTVQGILVTPCEIPELAVSIERARACLGFFGRK